MNNQAIFKLILSEDSNVVQWLEVCKEINHYIIILVFLVTVPVVFFLKYVLYNLVTKHLNSREAGHLAVSSEQ